MIEQALGDSHSPGAILLTTKGGNKDLGDEGYELAVSSEAIVIRALEPAGVFYGIQTLRQLLAHQASLYQDAAQTGWYIPGVMIEDKPRFRWRGLHLDVARHMFSVEAIKRYIDLMALHKMNTFHWHLTDDQGWRIEIKEFPKLTTIGSKRTATPIPSNRDQSDGNPYEGFYTQEQVKEIVTHAASRYVNIVPEIEMPGHALSALASYPHLGCSGGPYQVGTSWGVFEDVFCAGNEKVYDFLEQVLSQIMELFPGEYIHIGGDECPKTRWNDCPKCQAVITEHGLKDAHELQSFFIKRIAAFLSSKGRRMIGWDEILEGGLAPDATVMVWRDRTYGAESAQLGHDVIMCPTDYCYFDYYQSEDQDAEPPAIGGCLPLEKVYSFEPLPDTISTEQVVHFLGGQGNVWTEYISSPEQVEYMAFPRTTALAEVLWSPRGSRGYDDFTGRLSTFLEHLKRAGINYRDPFRERSAPG